MVGYRSPSLRPMWAPWLGQDQPPAPAPATPPPAVPVTYTGAPGVIETLAVLAASGAATWVGVRAGLKETGLLKYAGWVGGVGAGLIGLLYLGSKTGVSAGALPQVRVTP